MVLLVAGILLLAVVVFPQLVGASGSYVVLSGSMHPTIHAGDVVVSKHVEPSAIEEGDILVFHRESASNSDRTTHRVVDVVHRDDGLYFRTKGDANENPDVGLVSADDVIGRVWFHVPYIGHLLLFARTRAGLLSLVVLPCLLIVISEAYSLVGATRAKSEDEDETGGDKDETDGKDTR
ncbi:hypothetical protein A4G99_04385 [Haladaptatus sp. R4]|nr:hypothetical protein A4G99_04385 [Haladaptatus sp. R4]